ncbi:hypothetical protein EDF56_104508 [Novosphingobium sp. PhB165]|uniref:DUF3885 domain-containing protein n=1 Tax=Novosphingobium sp. PhB165 TaxID=2485105 RepID=UPI00104648EB|nr:hypothetical protein [Novosphingobium sp. PhB165]TCM18973.1 hypothetical protein EDF56_104508 [Novosphingobium sp. PhB165]
MGGKLLSPLYRGGMLRPSSEATQGSFLKHWIRAHPEVEPMGWKLRETAVPWVRFHALPGAKRYAENAAERAIILSRANALGTALLSAGMLCWIVQARADEAEGHGEFIGSYEEEEYEPVWRYYVREQEWISGAFDAEIAAVADDGPAYVLWISRETGGIFAPYDGGFDLFPSSDGDVEHLRTTYRDWLSDREDGL